MPLANYAANEARPLLASCHERLASARCCKQAYPENTAALQPFALRRARTGIRLPVSLNRLRARVVKILLVNVQLVSRSGTEVVCCETARGLRRRGHDVAIYVRHDGPPAEELRAEGFHVTSELSSITQTPDVSRPIKPFRWSRPSAVFPQLQLFRSATTQPCGSTNRSICRRSGATSRSTLLAATGLPARLPNLSGQIENSAERRMT